MEVILVFIMIICSGLFTGGVLTITWGRLSVWKKMNPQSFKEDFGHTIRITDKLQPILLVATILSTGIFSLSQDGVEQTLLRVAMGGFAITFLASVIVLVPLQKRILTSAESPARMYAKWQQGHMGRTALSLLSFFSLALSLSMLATN